VAVAVTQENGRIKVEWLIRWFTRLSSLPLLAASLFFGFAAAEIAQQDLFGYGSVRDDWLSLVLCVVFALRLGLPGLALATLRYFVELDQIMQQVIVTRQFGPVRFSSLRRLADFKLLTITDDGDERAPLRMYNVNLCGGGERPRFSSPRSANANRPAASHRSYPPRSSCRQRILPAPSPTRTKVTRR
jgi:hypothetical protein